MMKSKRLYLNMDGFQNHKRKVGAGVNECKGNYSEYRWL